MSTSEEAMGTRNWHAQAEEAQHVAKSGEILSHSLSSNDPENPMNWHIHRRIYASSVAWFFAFAV